MKDNPLISIVTPSFNQGKFIEETIISILNQTYSNIQFILVDGGSTDNTMEVVEKYRNKIDIIIHEEDKGQTDAINKGFRLAKGELVGWINSDDILYPECISLIVDLYKKNPQGAIFYYSVCDKINSLGEKIGKIEKMIPDRNYLLNYNYDIIQQGSFYKREFVENISYLNEDLHYCMDLDLWLKLLLHGNIFSIEEEAHSAFRFWDETKTQTGGAKFLKEIRKTILKNGGSKYSKNVMRTYLYEYKVRLKNILHINN